MAASKGKARSKGGLLPPKQSPAGLSGAAKNAGGVQKVKTGKKKRAASTVDASTKGGPASAKGTTSQSQKAQVSSKTAGVIDKYTGKKKGTLFSAAPAPAKPASDGSPSNSKRGAPKKAAAHATGQQHVAPPASNKRLPSASGQHTKKRQNPADAHDEPGQEGQGKKKRRKKAKTSKASSSSAHTGTEQRAAAHSEPHADGKSNWERLKAAAIAQSDPAPTKGKPKPRHTDDSQGEGGKRRRKQAKKNAAVGGQGTVVATDGIVDGKLVAKSSIMDNTDVVALDCEMVGVGNREGRKRDALARATLVNDHGNVLSDIWVKPKEKVTDYRFHVTGITAEHLRHGVSLEAASKQMHELIKGRILVGHAVHNDIKILSLQGTVPRARVRDTALYPPLMGMKPGSGKLFSLALKHVTKTELGIQIQKDEHDPVQDARAALYVYHKHREVWEMSAKAGMIKSPGVKTSAKLTQRFQNQRKMRAYDVGPQRVTNVALQRAQAVAAAGGGSDDEFAPPDAAAVARMKARLKGQTQDDMADL